MVVRKPDMNFDKEGRGSFLPYPPKIGDLYYSGVDRMPWFELDEDYFSGVLPSQLVQFRKEMRRSNQGISDLTLSSDFSKVESVLEYSNRNRALNELIALKSDALERTKGSFFCDIEIKWLGIDVYCQGYGSLIREGIFKKPDSFSSYANGLNKHGLFDINSMFIDIYTEYYIKNSKDFELEEITISEAQLDKILVGLL